MSLIVFIDTEVHPKSKKVIDTGGVKEDGSPFHSSSITDFINFIKDSQFICGHNIINHDLKYIKNAVRRIDDLNVNDTLFSHLCCFL